MARLVGFSALFAAGLLLAGGLAASGVADVTTTETLPVTTTVQETTTEKVTPTTATTTNASSKSSTPAWVWVVLAVLAAAVIGLLVAFFTQRGGISADERQRRLDAAVGTWAAQGWAIVNQTA